MGIIIHSISIQLTLYYYHISTRASIEIDYNLLLNLYNLFLNIIFPLLFPLFDALLTTLTPIKNTISIQLTLAYYTNPTRASWDT